MKILKHLHTYALCLAAALCLSACRADIAPIQSATVKSFSNGRIEQSWQLSAKQVRALNAWLADNSGGWDKVLSQHAPLYLVNATLINGEQATINVSNNVVAIAAKGEQQVQKFDATDLRELSQLLTSDTSLKQ